MVEKYDAAFLGMLQNERDIKGFLDSFFSFLYRKTDFYRLRTSSTDQMGFQPGVAKKLLMSAYQKYEAMALEDQKEKLDALKKQAEKEAAEKEALKKQAEKEAAEKEALKKQARKEAAEKAKKASVPEVARIEEVVAEGTPMDQATSDSTDAEAGKEVVAANQDSSGGASATKTTDDDDDVDPELARMQKIFQANPESYNGAIRDKYSWSQSITDVDVRVKVPKHICKGKDVKVDIGKKHLQVLCKDSNGQMETVVDGELTWECHKDECIWSLVPGEHIHINLEKAEERWWEALLTDEPKISIRKINPSRPITDLDDEAQAKIEEMMYNERQKRLGLPQTRDKKVHDILEKAWDAEGSPFKGQPFDLSKINVSMGGD